MSTCTHNDLQKHQWACLGCLDYLVPIVCRAGYFNVCKEIFNAQFSSTRNTTGTAQYKWRTQKVWNFFKFFKIINNDVWYISIRQWVRNPCPKVRQGQSRMSENESQLTKISYSLVHAESLPSQGMQISDQKIYNI